MAEAIAVIGIVASIAQLVQLTVSIGTGLHQVHSTYEDGASLTLKSISRECKVLEKAFSQIRTWVEDVLRYQQGAAGRVKDLEEAFSGFREPLSMLDEEVRKVLKDSKGESELGFKAKVRFLWNEETVKEYRDEVRWMAQALQLLLSASQLLTNGTEQAEKISHITKTISVHNKARSINQNGSIWSEKEFTFDEELVTSVAYRRAYKSFSVASQQLTSNVPRQRKRPWNALGLFKNRTRRMLATPLEETQRPRDSSDIQPQPTKATVEPWRFRVSGSSPASRDPVRPTDPAGIGLSLVAIDRSEPGEQAPPSRSVPAHDIIADPWAQVRQNAANRRTNESSDRKEMEDLGLVKAQNARSGKIDEGETSGEESIESRVARIKARVAELTGATPSQNAGRATGVAIAVAVTEQEYDFRALFTAIEDESESEVRSLLYHRTGEPRNVQLPPEIRHTIETDLLHKLCKVHHGHKVLQLLMAHATLKLDVNFTNGYGNTPLANAVWSDSAEAVDVLLRFGANINVSYLYSNGDYVALVRLAFRRRSGVLQKLLQAGADPDQRGAGELTTLALALMEQECAATALLLSHGASPYTLVGTTNAHAAMYVNCSFDRTDEVPQSLCRCLCSYNVDLAALRDEFGYTLLHDAAIYGNDVVARFLIEEAKVSRLAKCDDGRMAWEMVSKIKTKDENTGVVTESLQKVTDQWPYDLRPPP